MRTYNCLKQNKFQLNEYQLLPIRHEDILLIKNWRNAQIHKLRQLEPLTDEMQKKYFDEIVWPTFDMKQPPHVLFSYLCDDECIGYGGIVHISWQNFRAEVSFLLEPERAESNELCSRDFSVFLELIKQIAFEDIGLNRLFTETYDFRPIHISTLEECGFQLEGRMQQHVLLDGEYHDSLIHGLLKE